MAPPSSPRSPHPTPTMSSRYFGSNSSDYSYFSASAPNTTSSNPSDHTRSAFTAPVPHAHYQLHTHSTEFTKPIITCSVTSSTNSFAHQGASHHPQYHHTHPPPAPSDALRQFTLHIPAPPQLMMPPKMTGGRQQGHSSLTSSTSTSGSSDSQHQHQPLQSPQSRHSESNPPSSSSQAPDMTCCTELCQYLLVVSRLPPTITSNMVTISANKGDRLRVNAQAWGGENAGELSYYLFMLLLIIFFFFHFYFFCRNCSTFRVANFFSAARCGPFKGPGKI